MNAFDAAAVMTPLGFYFGYLAWMNRRGAVRVVSGAADIVALAAGLFGFVFIGPIQMLVPIDALIARGWVIWLMTGALYLLFMALIGLSRRPRMVIYHISPDLARQAFKRLAVELDSDAQMAGNAAYLPANGAELLLDVFPATGTAQVLLRQGAKDPAWRVRFFRQTAETFAQTESGTATGPLRRCFSLLFLISVIGTAALMALYTDEIFGGLLFYLYS